jgi:hypothetical protein
MLITGLVPVPVQQSSDAWQPLDVAWFGADGSVWDLADPDGGVVLTPDGIKGMGMPGFDRYTSQSPSRAGSRYRGSRTQERDVFWPIFVWSDTSSVDFLARDGAFWQSLRPDVPGTWQITQPDGTTRSLDCRLVDDSDNAYTLDPSLGGWATYGISLVADDQPYWYGQSIERVFSPSATRNWLVDDASGVFYISPGGSTSSASMPNLGDVNAWPTWTVDGAIGGAVLGVASGSIIVPAISAFDRWIIDTRPDQMTAFDVNGADRSSELVWDPAPIPPGQSVPLTTTLIAPTGSASVRCKLTPLYFRALG